MSVYALDSRFRGNDVGQRSPVIPAEAGIQVARSFKACKERIIEQCQIMHNEGHTFA
jgi:hypothetical protein